MCLRMSIKLTSLNDKICLLVRVGSERREFGWGRIGFQSVGTPTDHTDVSGDVSEGIIKPIQ